jgi:hypothetical protein
VSVTVYGAFPSGFRPAPFRLPPLCSERPAGIETVSAQDARLQQSFGTHKLAVVLHLGAYNFVRVHNTLVTTPAVAAGLEEAPWDLERVVEMTADYMRRKEDAKFEEAFAAL